MATASVTKVIEIAGMGLQRVSSCMEVLDIFLAERRHAVLESCVLADKHRTESTGTQTVVHAIASILGT